MCLGIPGQVVERSAEHPDLASVDVCGVRRTVNVGLVTEEGLEVGDWVLIHVGFALSRIDEQEAKASLELLEGMGRAYTDELAALAQSDIG